MRVDLEYVMKQMESEERGIRQHVLGRIYRRFELSRLQDQWTGGWRTISWLGIGHAQVLQIRIRPLE